MAPRVEIEGEPREKRGPGPEEEFFSTDEEFPVDEAEVAREAAQEAAGRT